MIRSPMFYVGDKYKLMKQILNVFPKNINRLIEPFCGGGSVFLNSNFKHNIVNDFNKNVINIHLLLSDYKFRRNEFFNILENEIIKRELSASALNINVSLDLKKKFIKTYYAQYNKEKYLKMRDDYNKDKSNYILLYLLLIYGFNHMIRFNKNGDFNLPVGNVDYNNNVKKALNDYFDFIENNTVEYTCFDFEYFLSNIPIDKNDIIYVDPPYLISDSEYNKNWSENDEIRLLKKLDDLSDKGYKFVLSNVLYHKGMQNKILLEWSKKYKIIDVKSNYISYHDNTIKNTREVVILNYE